MPGRDIPPRLLQAVGEAHENRGTDVSAEEMQQFSPLRADLDLDWKVLRWTMLKEAGREAPVGRGAAA
jgi:hypothetical protein